MDTTFLKVKISLEANNLLNIFDIYPFITKRSSAFFLALKWHSLGGQPPLIIITTETAF